MSGNDDRQSPSKDQNRKDETNRRESVLDLQTIVTTHCRGVDKWAFQRGVECAR